MYAHLQRGADDAALTALQRLQNTAGLEPTFKTAFHLASTAARYALERKAWTEAAALVPRQPAALPWDRFPWPEAVTVFARGLGELRTGDTHRAQASYARLLELEGAAKASGEAIFERNVLMLRLALAAHMAQASGDLASALSLMREAAEVEEQTPKHAVTPAPTLPAREMLAGLRAEQGKHREALDEYARALSSYPNRFNCLIGSAQAAIALGDSSRAGGFFLRLQRIADSISTRAAVQTMREFLLRAKRS